jgi:hypothetical protein
MLRRWFRLHPGAWLNTDDAIIVAAVLRSVVRGAGIGAVRANWPGSDDGFAAPIRRSGLVKIQTTTTARRMLRMLM